MKCILSPFIAAIAIAMGACSSYRQNTEHTESLSHGILRIEAADSTYTMMAATIDSPEIILESPTLPGGRAIVRGRRLKVSAGTKTTSNTRVEGDTTDKTTTVTDSEKKQQAGPTWPATWAALCVVVAAISFIIGRKCR